jgi:hypothetical protein
MVTKLDKLIKRRKNLEEKLFEFELKLETVMEKIEAEKKKNR